MLINLTNIDKIKSLMQNQTNMDIDEYKPKLVSAVFEFSPSYDISEFYIDEIMSEKWPSAVDPLLIANDTDEDKNIRAEMILDLVVVDKLDGLKFLDFGCGEGHVAEQASSRAALSVGYDTTDYNWQGKKAIFTTSREEVDKHAPYDVVLLYDVLDHTDFSQIDMLQYACKVAKDKIIVRAHPWCSRHGTHLYRTLNKAYAHFFLSDDEIKKRGYKQLVTTKVLAPEYTYAKWFKEANLTVVSKQVSHAPVEDFFRQSHLVARINGIYGQIWGGRFPEAPMSQQFIDYTLVRSPL
jgi:2-polyprenyl-3-methyl-5-hydroxy-6-metoxy-1,4-benzoquinol methylase